MNNSKIQHSSINETSNADIQSLIPAPGGFWGLKLGNLLRGGAWCLMLLFTIHARAQSYSIPWFTIDGGGGGTSTSSVFSVTGTIGQPNAGKMSGTNYTVEGGYWTIIEALQQPGAPLLSITLSNSFAIVSWPTNSTGFVLQENNNLSLNNWSAVAQSASTNNGRVSVTVPAGTGYKFYRLKE